MTGAGLHLIVRLGGERIALPGAELDSVVEIDVLTAVPLAPPHVAGLAALRSRVLTVIDGNAALGFGPSQRPAGEAVMLECDGHAYAVLVEAVEDAIDIDQPREPSGAGLAAAWARVAAGTVMLDGATLLVVSPAAIVAGPGAVAPVNPALTRTL